MDAITSFPEPTELQLTARLQHWREIARSTLPVPREAAREAICALYRASGRDPPAVIFLPSPVSCLQAWRALRALPDERVQRHFGASITDRIRYTHWQGYVPERMRILRAALSRRRLADVIERSLTQLGEHLFQVQRAVRNQLHLDHPHPWEDIWHLIEPEVSQLESSLSRRIRAGLRRRWLLQPAAPDLPPPVPCWGGWGCHPEAVEDCLDCLGVWGAAPPDPVTQTWIRQAEVCHWWLPFEGIVLASDRPREMSLDGCDRLHGEEGAAIEYSDGLAVFAWHGLPVEKRIVTAPRSISLAQIDASNVAAAMRRVMITRYGPARYLQESGVVIHQDERGRLWRVNRPGDTPLVMVEVRNATPEPDGSVKTFFLRVPPEVTCASEAVAWTFGLAAERYAPTLET